MTPRNSTKPIRVLYLDDEDNNLRSFKAAFRRDYEVYTANNTEDAFSILKSHRPQVIFSDQRMPVTSGVEFFNAVRQVFPEPVRILITGFTDVNDIIDAINKGHVYRYITKPWSEAEIKVAIENAYDLYHTRRQLKDKIEDLEKTNNELNRFVYSVSHDLRAPIASVLGLVKVAGIDVTDPMASELFEKVDRSVHKLDLLVNNIIDYYKNSKATEEYVEVNLENLVEDVLNQLHSGENRENLSLQKSISQNARFFGDYFRIRIVLSHLIANAIKFKKPEQQTAQVDLKFGIEEEKVHIIVKDHGVGILQDHVEQIFKMFFRGKDQMAGYGLGLYIVKEALAKMGGTIDVHSSPGEGAEFHIIIPNMISHEDE